jgi:hypothetical protein
MSMPIWTPRLIHILTDRQRAWRDQSVTVVFDSERVFMSGLGLTLSVAEFPEEVTDVCLDYNFSFTDEYSNVLGLAEWLDHECHFPDSASMLGYFSKSSNWEREYFLWRGWENAATPELSEEFSNAVCDNDITARDILLSQHPVTA